MFPESVGYTMDFVPLTPTTYDFRLAVCQALRELPSDVVRHEIWPRMLSVLPPPRAPRRRLGRVTRHLRDRGRRNLNAQFAMM